MDEMTAARQTPRDARACRIRPRNDTSSTNPIRQARARRRAMSRGCMRDMPATTAPKTGINGTTGIQYNRRSFTLRRARTVSYTHLRAHETVLDLVCRLLLEKKKK